MKAYTSLEQSKKLAEILPIESADMMWKKELKQRLYSDEHKVSESDFLYLPLFKGSSIMMQNFDIPCWSLAMLLEIIANVAARIDEDGYLEAVICQDVHAVCLINCNVELCKTDSLVDACYEMIINLHEQKIL